MPFLLDGLYVALLFLLSPWIVWTSLRTGKYREGFGEKLLGRAPKRRGIRTCIWFHAVSVGEVVLLVPLVTELRRRRPDVECVVSTTTKTGKALADSRFPDLVTFYCPLDFSWAVRAAMHRVRPDLVVLAELELWPNLIRAAKVRGAKIAVVNGRLSDGSFQGYRRIRRVLAPTFARLDLVTAQNEESADRFRALGSGRGAVHVTGSVKFDGAETDRNNPQTARLRELAGYPPDATIFLAGSTQEPEEALALTAYRELAAAYPKLRLILVPRHPERFASVAELLESEGVEFTRRSRLGMDSPGADPKVLLVDAVGELAAWWGLANIAFVGGSLTNRGGQNMIEPAAYGAAVSFGPNTQNFRDIVAALRNARAAKIIAGGNELTAFVRRCLEDPGYARRLGSRARQLVLGELGATARTCDLIEPLIIAKQSSQLRRAGSCAPACLPR